jgi:hypothetical protein
VKTSDEKISNGYDKALEILNVIETSIRDNEVSGTKKNQKNASPNETILAKCLVDQSYSMNQTSMFSSQPPVPLVSSSAKKPNNDSHTSLTNELLKINYEEKQQGIDKSITLTDTFLENLAKKHNLHSDENDEAYVSDDLTERLKKLRSGENDLQGSGNNAVKSKNIEHKTICRHKNYTIDQEVVYSKINTAVRLKPREINRLIANQKIKTLLNVLDEHLKQKNMAWLDKQNDELEAKYPSNDYSVIIYSKGIDEKCKISEPFLEEIERCTKVTKESIESITVVKDKDMNNTPGIQINLTSYKDFKILKSLKSWKDKAFKTGVYSLKPLPPKLYVIINNVDIGVELSKDELQQLESEYGLVDVVRLTDAEGRESRKLKANVKSKWHYLNVIRGGVRLYWRKRKVTPDLRKARPCNQCGSLRHSGKRIKCTLGPRCTLCSGKHFQSEHESSEATRKCLNCGKEHPTFDRGCALVRKRSKELNRFVLNILVGEGIFKNEDEAFADERDHNGDIIKQEGVANSNDLKTQDGVQMKNLISNLIKSEMEVYKSELNQNRSEVAELKERVLSCENSVKSIESSLIKTNESISSLRDTVDKLPTTEKLSEFGKELSKTMMTGFAELLANYK